MSQPVPDTSKCVFLSTPSARRATCMPRCNPGAIAISIHALREEGDARLTQRRVTMSYFYPRPPRGGRRTRYRREINQWRFLSTPSARRATASDLLGSVSGLFLSTPSARRATPKTVDFGEDIDISIHALREEGDKSDFQMLRQVGDFYPRPPRGGRRRRTTNSHRGS